MLKILKNNEPILFKKATPVLEVTTELRKFASELFATMTLNNGLGLSAPQVNRSICAIVFDCTKYSNNVLDSGYFFNPEVLEQSKELVSAKEGCLSYPGEYCEVARPKWVKIKYLNLANKEIEQTYSGLVARVILHEIEHLQGITLFNRKGANEP